MKKLSMAATFCLLLIVGMVAVGTSSADDLGVRDPRAEQSDEHHWPQWRGPLSTGRAPHADPPVTWSEEKNIRWKVELAGKGHSTPAIWGDRIFVTMAIPFGDSVQATSSGEPGAHTEALVTRRHKFVVMAINRGNGDILWTKTVHQAVPHAGGHVTASLASQSPITDGKHIFAFFGSYGLYCLSLEGDLIWEKDLGRIHSLHGHGEGSSPALHENTLIVNWDHEGPSFLAAFEKRSGRELWRVDREPASSWTSPIVVTQNDAAQVIVSGSKRVCGYDLRTGTLIWQCHGLSTENVVASPVAGHGMVFVGSTYDHRAILAIRLEGATGDVTKTSQVAWQRHRGAPYVPSPLLYGDFLYVLQHSQGIISRIDSHTGEAAPEMLRLPGIRNVFASPVGAAGDKGVSVLN